MWIDRKQRGDTIIEVLLAMAVIGLTLGVSYGIANRAIQTGRNAQERSEAVKLAEAQIELLKYNTSPSVKHNYSAGPALFCVLPGSPQVDASTAINACKKVNGTFYNISMEYAAGAPGVYRSIVTWDSESNSEGNRVVISYRP